MKSLAGSFWHARERRWIVRATPDNTTRLQAYFGCWSASQYTQIQAWVAQGESNSKLRLTVYDEAYFAVQTWHAPALVAWIKTQSGRRYDEVQRRWLVPRDHRILEWIKQASETHGVAFLDHSPQQQTYDRYAHKGDWGAYKKYQLRKYPEAIHPLLQPHLDTLVRERYSKNTIKNYTSAFARFLLDCHRKQLPLGALDMVHIKPYLTTISEQDIAYQTLNRHYSAIQFWYEKVARKGSFQLSGLARPRKTKPLPKVLSQGEVKAIFGELNNLKHRCMLYLAYGAGLRSGEIVHLRTHDLHFEQGEIRVCKGKGAKDRIVMLGEGLGRLLQRYIAEYEPSFWLFEG